MKKTLGILLFAVLSCTASIAQKHSQSIPQQVALQFGNKFTHIQQVQWSIADDNKYQARFQDRGITKKVVYANSGQWLVIESPASQQDFPQAVNRSLSQNFSGYQVNQATRMELFGKGISFRIRIQKGNGSLDVEIDTNGNVRRRVEVVEVYEGHHGHHDDCHHHHHGHHDHCDHHKHKDKHKHKHGKGHKHHDHDEWDD